MWRAALSILLVTSLLPAQISTKTTVSTATTILKALPSGVVGSGFANTCASSPCTPANTTSVVSGDKLFACLGANINAATLSVTDSNSNTYSSVGTQQNFSAFSFGCFAATNNATNAALTITGTASGSPTHVNPMIVDLGAAYTTVDGTASASRNTTNVCFSTTASMVCSGTPPPAIPNSRDVTTTHAVEVLVACMTSMTNSPPTAGQDGNSNTYLDTGAKFNTTVTAYCEYMQVTSTNSFGAAASVNTAKNGAMILAAFF